MEFRLDEDQVALQETVRRFCADRLPLDGVAAREATAVDRDLWRELGELGVFGLLLPELAGEGPFGAVGAAIVFEELGAHLAPGPLAWTVLAGPLVEAATAGELVVGGIDRDATGHATDGPAAVEWATDLDALLVVADDGVALVPGAELGTPEPLVSFDPLTTVGAFADVPTGERIGDAAAAAHLRLVGVTLAAASAVGVASRALEVARTYALERQQFDVPIGSFQAIKHMLADMYVRTNLARSATWAAAAAADGGGAVDPVKAAAGAKVLAGEAAIANSKTAVQVLGGMGFTWDMPPNYLLKRAWALEHTFGTADDHALTISEDLTREVA